MGSSIVIKAVKWHLEDLIGLPQSIPRSVVSFVHLNGMSIRRGETTGMLLKCIQYMAPIILFIVLYTVNFYCEIFKPFVPTSET